MHVSVTDAKGQLTELVRRGRGRGQGHTYAAWPRRRAAVAISHDQSATITGKIAP